MTVGLDAWIDEFGAAVARGRAHDGLRQLIARLDGRETTLREQAAERLFRLGHHAEVVALLDVALRAGEAPTLRYWRGNALRMLGQADAAERDLRAALRMQPTLRDAAFSLAYLLREDGRIDAATAVVVDLWQALRTREIAGPCLDFLRECGAHASAGDIASHAATHWPEDAALCARAGEILLSLGHFDAAQSALRNAVDRDHGQGAACLRLAQCHRFLRADDIDIARFRTILSDSEQVPMARICAGFALAKALDDLGDRAQSAAVLRRANADAAIQAPWNAAAWEEFVERQTRAPAWPSFEADAGFVPVFIVGLPRTGTTLLASRLARHPDVRDRGELNWIPMLHDHLQAQRQLRDPKALAAVARFVAMQMRRDDARARCIIDKNPLNFRHLDFIRALFPSARIIHCVRDERDTALSIWQQHFAHADLAFAYRFDTIADVMRGHARLMRHWREAAGIPLLEVSYEDVIADEAGILRKLGAFLGLRDDESPAADAARVITTASVWQARQATYTGSVGRWRSYAAYLPELEQQFPVPVRS